MLTRYDLCRSFFGDVCQHEVGHNAHIGSREELDQVGNQTNVGRSADAVDVVSTRGSQSSRGASSESQGLLNEGEGAIGSSTFAFNVELVGGPGELGVLISRKHMEAVVEGLHSAVDVVPGAVRAGSSCSCGSSCSGSSSSGGGRSRGHCGGGDLIVTQTEPLREHQECGKENAEKEGTVHSSFQLILIIDSHSQSCI